jgi:hypothetical protein
MKLYGYGEDALTLWALKMKLPEILEALEDNSHSSDCELFFRPSFGRRGGEKSSQFGEFDFLILAKDRLYLGESKWDRSPEVTDTGTIELRKEQIVRHRLMAFYVRHWVFGQYSSWEEFYEAAPPLLKQEEINKTLPLYDRLLTKNLKSIKKIISRHFSNKPAIHNVLLYLYRSSGKKPLPIEVKTSGFEKVKFEIVKIKYPVSDIGNYISIEI